MQNKTIGLGATKIPGKLGDFKAPPHHVFI
jgi:hypothetical protein